MVKIGQMVQFRPSIGAKDRRTAEEFLITPVNGEVVFVNPANGFFVAEYEAKGTILKEGFCFADIGKAVSIVNRNGA